MNRKGERPKMATEPATMNWREYVGRFSVEFNVANHEDVVLAKEGSCLRSRCAGPASPASWRRKPPG